MINLTYLDEKKTPVIFPKELTAGKRSLRPDEIELLEKNLNSSEYKDWSNVLVSDEFDASLIKSSSFSGFVIIGKLKAAKLKFHDLELETGIYRSHLINVVTGDYNVIRN